MTDPFTAPDEATVAGRGDIGSPSVGKHSRGDAARSFGYVHVALLGGVCGLVSDIPGLPSAVAAILLVVFVGLGPGCLVVCFLDELPSTSRYALVPTVGFAITSIVVTASTALHLYDPRIVLAALAGVSVAVAGLLLARAASHGGRSA